MEEIPKFKDFTMQRKPIEGGKVKIEEILNRPIVVTNYSVSDSKHYKGGDSQCLKVQFYEAADETKTKKIFFSGSAVLIEQIENAKAELEQRGLPCVFSTAITKITNYYSFT